MFVDSEKLKKIGITTRKEKLLARGESGFKIDSKISFRETIERIENLTNLLAENVQVELNPFRRLTYRELNPIINDLETALIDEYYEDYCNSEEKEIFHPNLIDYLKTENVQFSNRHNKFVISTSEEITLVKIFNHFYLGQPLSRELFQRYLKSIETSIYDTLSGQYIHLQTLVSWLFGEVYYKGKKYIKFEGSWYTFSANYETDLHARIDNLSNKIETIYIHDWSSDYGKESDYNDAFYSFQKNCIIGDTCFYKNIEIADAIIWDENEINFIHVKDKLDRNLRVLQSQIINSSKHVRQFLQDLNHPGILEYYNQLAKQASKKKLEIISFKEFQNVLQRKKVCFSFCFATKNDSSSLKEILEEIKDSNSTIAKLALLDTYYSMKNLDFTLKVGKIKKVKD